MGTGNPEQDPIGYWKLLSDLLGEEVARTFAQLHAGIPTLTDEKILPAVTVIPTDY